MNREQIPLMIQGDEIVTNEFETTPHWPNLNARGPFVDVRFPRDTDGHLAGLDVGIRLDDLQSGVVNNVKNWKESDASSFVSGDGDLVYVNVKDQEIAVTLLDKNHKPTTIESGRYTYPSFDKIDLTSLSVNRDSITFDRTRNKLVIKAFSGVIVLPESNQKNLEVTMITHRGNAETQRYFKGILPVTIDSSGNMTFGRLTLEQYL